MARVWTGFAQTGERAKKNGSFGQDLDPLGIVASFHDQFPKQDLTGGYIGDGYPQCSDLPHQDFLHKGATYLFQNEIYSDRDGKEMPFVQLEEGTQLYEFLCNRDSSGQCSFQSEYKLPETLACDGLCSTPTLDLVKVGTAVFRYAGRPCVNYAFYNNGTEADGYCLDPEWHGCM